MSATERQFNPTVSLFEENRDTLTNEQTPEQAQPISLSQHFKSGVNLAPQEPQVTLQSLLDNPQDQIQLDDLEKRRLADSAMGVSQVLNDAPQGMSVQQPKRDPSNQSDLCFGIGSVLGVAKDAIRAASGAPEPEQDIADLELQQRLMNPVLNPFLRPTGPSGMGGMN